MRKVKKRILLLFLQIEIIRTYKRIRFVKFIMSFIASIFNGNFIMSPFYGLKYSSHLINNLGFLLYFHYCIIIKFALKVERMSESSRYKIERLKHKPFCN